MQGPLHVTAANNDYKQFKQQKIMKKYIKPAISVVDVETEKILAGSKPETMNVYQDETEEVYAPRYSDYDVWDD